MPAGRPTDYDPAYCQLVIEHGARGMSFETFGPSVGVHRSTLYAWCDKHPEFQDARKQCQDARAEWWEGVLRAGVLGEIQNFSAAAAIFALKQQGWQDKQQLELSGRDGKAIELAATREATMSYLKDPKTAAALELLAEASQPAIEAKS